MNEHELKILAALGDVWNLFVQLPVQHQDDQNDFRFLIHRLQDMIAARPAFRGEHTNT